MTTVWPLPRLTQAMLEPFEHLDRTQFAIIGTVANAENMRIVRISTGRRFRIIPLFYPWWFYWNDWDAFREFQLNPDPVTRDKLNIRVKMIHDVVNSLPFDAQVRLIRQMSSMKTYFNNRNTPSRVRRDTFRGERVVDDNVRNNNAETWRHTTRRDFVDHGNVRQRDAEHESRERQRRRPS